jgi:transcriptional regulator with XRE-family HTH domain
MTLRAARVNKGLGQKEAANLLKISNTTLCSWENGRSFPNAEKIKAICETYGVSYDDLNFLPGNPL